MNIQRAIEKAEELTGINAQQVLNDLEIGYDSLSFINVSENKQLLIKISEKFKFNLDLLLYLGHDAEDITPNKVGLYKALKPVIDGLLDKIKETER